MGIPYGLHALIDGDILRYRLGFAAERTVYIVTVPGHENYIQAENANDANWHAKEKGGIVWSRKDLQPVSYALKMVDNQLEGIFNVLLPSGYTIYLSGQGNFRTKIAETREYKAGRGPRPTHYKAIGEHLVSKYNAVTVNGREADDALGVHLSAEPSLRVLVSIDKDLDQIWGWHYNFVTGKSYWVDRRSGDYAFYVQLLTGDVTDNIPGIDGIGPAGARQILDGAKSSAELCRRVWDVYRARSDSTESALRYFREQTGLLWIQRTDLLEYTPPGGWAVLEGSV